MHVVTFLKLARFVENKRRRVTVATFEPNYFFALVRADKKRKMDENEIYRRKDHHRVGGERGTTTADSSVRR